MQLQNTKTNLKVPNHHEVESSACDSPSEISGKDNSEVYLGPYQTSTTRISHQRCSMKRGVLKNFAKFTRKHLCLSLLFNKVAGLKPATLLKKRLWHRGFPMNFPKFFRKPFLKNTSGLLLLYDRPFLRMQLQ